MLNFQGVVVAKEGNIKTASGLIAFHSVNHLYWFRKQNIVKWPEIFPSMIKICPLFVLIKLEIDLGVKSRNYVNRLEVQIFEPTNVKQTGMFEFPVPETEPTTDQ